MLKYILRNLTAVLDAFLDRLAKVEPHIDPGESILFRGLREAGEEAFHGRRIVAGAAGRQTRATGGERDAVRAKETPQDSCGCRTGYGVSGIVIGYGR